MNKKYCIVSDTYFIKDYVHPYNIRYTFSGNSLDHPESKLDFDFEFTQDFFKHIRFYEVTFNEKDQPIYLNYLKDNRDNIELPNGWLSLNDYFVGVNYKYIFFKPRDQWYNSNTDLFRALLKWGKEVSRQAILESIVDDVENQEDKE